jgi:uncharacterized protein DUF6789
MIGRKIRNAFIAGFCGTVVHSLLILVHSRSGPLPGFQPNEDIQRGLSWLLGTEVDPAFVWLLSFVNGAIVWGFVFGQTYRFLPGNSPWLKGVYFGVCAWLAMGFLFFPLVDRGIFAAKLGLGIAPAMLMLGALLAYSVTMSLVYNLLDRASADS